jgi:hypothetical protein
MLRLYGTSRYQLHETMRAVNVRPPSTNGGKTYLGHLQASNPQPASPELDTLALFNNWKPPKLETHFRRRTIVASWRSGE